MKKNQPFDICPWQEKTSKDSNIRWISTLAGGVTRNCRITVSSNPKSTEFAFKIFWEFMFEMLEDRRIVAFEVRDGKDHFHFFPKTKPMIRSVRFSVWPKLMMKGCKAELDANNRYVGNEKSIDMCIKLLASSLTKSKALEIYAGQLDSKFEVVLTDCYDKAVRQVLFP